MRKILTPSLDWLLIFIPLTAVVRWLYPDAGTAVFISAALAIVPLAGWLGRATEHMADHTSQSIGGLLNATFGNATEMIIAIMALRSGLTGVVKASLTGSIIGNILLVLGASILAGGMRFKTQRFNATGARVRATMLMLAAIGLVIPAAYHHLGGPAAAAREADLSFEIAIVLLVTYGLGLLFSLHTHRHILASGGAHLPAQPGAASWTVKKSFAVLAGATALIAWMSEVLVGSVESAAHALGMTELFVGVVVVAIIGNAAEHSSAIQAALRDRMELSVEIAIGSSIQIALFVAPALVLISRVIGTHPMDLVFTPAEVMAVGIAVLITEQISGDGECNWLEGAQLLAVYIVLAMVFYFLPATAAAH